MYKRKRQVLAEKAFCLDFVGKFTMTNDTRLQLGSRSSRTNSSLPRPEDDQISFYGYYSLVTSSSGVSIKCGVTRMRRFFKRKLHGYAKLRGPPRISPLGIRTRENPSALLNAVSPWVYSQIDFSLIPRGTAAAAVVASSDFAFQSYCQTQIVLKSEAQAAST